MEKAVKVFFFFGDICLLPIVYLMSYVLYVIRIWGINKFRLCNRFLLKQGILPTRDYFYASSKSEIQVSESS